MRTRRWIFLIVLAIVALVLYFEPTHCVRGWLRGEAFFDGRPTSYWRGVIEHDLHEDPLVVFGQVPPPRASTWQKSMRWIGLEPATNLSRRMLENETAAPVLCELHLDDNDKIAGFATDALVYMDVNGRTSTSANCWMRLVNRYNLKHQPLDLP